MPSTFDDSWKTERWSQITVPSICWGLGVQIWINWDVVAFALKILDRFELCN